MKKLITIQGLHHSGSTWLNCMLGKHDDCFAVGEVYRIARFLNNYKTPSLVYRCSCSNKILPCKFWRYVVDKVNTHDKNVFNVVSNRSGKSIIIDDSKRSDWLEPFIGSFKGVVKVIHLSKSPERHIASCLKYRKIHNRKLDLDDIINPWIEYNQSVFDFCDRKGYNRINQRFIDLVNNNESELRKLCDFIGITYQEGLQEYWDVDEHHILGGNPKVIVAYKDKNKGEFDNIDQKRYDRNITDFPNYEGIYRRKFSEVFNPDEWKEQFTSEMHKAIWDNKDLRIISKKLGYEKLEF